MKDIKTRQTLIKIMKGRYGNGRKRQVLLGNQWNRLQTLTDWYINDNGSVDNAIIALEKELDLINNTKKGNE